MKIKIRRLALPFLLLSGSVHAQLPQLFAPGTISTADDEFGAQPSADGHTLWFSRSIPRSKIYVIFTSNLVGTSWSKPQVAAFSGVWRDYDPVLSPDGNRLWFISDRPLQSDEENRLYNVWFVDKRHGGWSKPVPLGAPINGSWNSHFAVSTASGTLYFTSDRPGSKGWLDVWKAQRVGNTYAAPENLGDTINNPNWANFEVFVTPDERAMIVSAYGHDDSLGDCDLYISFNRNSKWTPLVNMGSGINSAARDYSARISVDGKQLYFSSERGFPTQTRNHRLTADEFEIAVHGIENGLGNIYRVEFDVSAWEARAMSELNRRK